MDVRVFCFKIRGIANVFNTMIFFNIMICITSINPFTVNTNAHSQERKEGKYFSH